MSSYVYTLHNVSKIVPPKKFILKDIYLSFFPGAKIGVLGLNGSGKTSLLKILAGIDKEFDGVATSMSGLRIGYLPQEPQLDPTKTVRENLEEGLRHLTTMLEEYNAITEKFASGSVSDEEMAQLLERFEELQNKIDAVEDCWSLDRKLEMASEALRLPNDNSDVSLLSGGERRRVALCRLLLSEPDMLLLDEPTNHLDALSVQWLERFLERFCGTVIAVTHDRYFLDNVAEWILELDRGQGIPWKGNYSSWLEQKEQRLKVESKQEQGRIKAMQSELEWVRSNPKGRQAKNKARLARFEELSSVEVQSRQETNEIYIPPGPRLGGLVIEVKDLQKKFGDRLLFNRLSFQLPPGGIVGVIGPNGVGKTTLFRMLAGEEKPDGGTIKIGETVRLAYVDQSRDTLSPEKTVWEEISEGQDIIQVGTYTTQSRSYVARFNFKGTDQQKTVGSLSGGERNRVHLAKVLRSGGNVLLLDEPTNDLDVETLRALEEALLNFPGCAVIISHDRWFLDRVATHILSFEKKGKDEMSVRWFEGNYAEYLDDCRERLGESGGPAAERFQPLGG